MAEKAFKSVNRQNQNGYSSTSHQKKKQKNTTGVTSKVEKNIRHTNLPDFLFSVDTNFGNIQVRGSNLKIFQNLQIRVDLVLAESVLVCYCGVECFREPISLN